jgi:N-acetylmuramoyl-L-alanine amidase
VIRAVGTLLLSLVLSSAGSDSAPPRPSIVWKPVPMTADRLAETAAYSQRHYGQRTWRLSRPRVIVEHFTANRSFSATWSTFASDAADPELHERPGVCAHFVIDRDGTIYQLVRLGVRCRHTVGLNWTAIGIEHVGLSDAEVLGNRRQLAASINLTRWLMARYGIDLGDVIGHAESLGSPYHHERYAAWRCQTHRDFARPAMDRYRTKLARAALAADVPLGRRVHRVPSGC